MPRPGQAQERRGGGRQGGGRRGQGRQRRQASPAQEPGGPHGEAGARPRADRPRGQAALPGLPAQGAPALLDSWLRSASRSRAREIKELSKKARRHRDAIVRAVGLGLSNARAEAVSNKIKLTVRMGYGFRNVDNLIALVMLRCSNLPIELPGRL